MAIATSGPGATNLVTGIADAKMDSVPLVCITGQVRSPLIGSDAFQETDVFGMTLSLTKWNRLVRTIEELPHVIAEGFYWARSGRPGPVVIDIPLDILKASMEFSGPVQFTPPRLANHVGAESTFAATLVAMLQQAKKPVALVGAGAKLSGAVEDLQQLLDLLNIPSFATVHGLGAVKPDSSYYLGMVGMHGTRAANLALDETDLLLVFGARLDDRVTGEPTRFAPHAKIAHFEIDPAQLDRVRPCDLPVIGNLAETIPTFYQEAKHAHLPEFSAWRAVACGPERAERKQSAETGDPRKPGLAHPTKSFLQELFSRMPKDGSGFILADVGQHQMWSAQCLRISSPRGFITSGGLGAMGFALPAAIGVQLSNPNRARAVRLGRRRIPDEHPGTGDRAPVGTADQDGHHRQQISRHGAAVAGAVFLLQLCRDRPERQPGFRRDCQGLQDRRFDDQGRGVPRSRPERERGAPTDPLLPVEPAGVARVPMPPRGERLPDGTGGFVARKMVFEKE